MQGNRSHWATIMQAWRQLRDEQSPVVKFLGPLAFMVKRECLEPNKFGKFERLNALMWLDQSGMGIKCLVEEETHGVKK